jgi:hypothetical protein
MKAVTVPTTVEIKRTRLLGLIATVALLAAVITWSLSTYVGSGGGKAQTANPDTGLARAAVSTRRVPNSGGQMSVIMSMTPAELQAGALGGYALPTYASDSSLDEVLASMSPATRRFTTKIMALTIEQLKAGAAGSP